MADPNSDDWLPPGWNVEVKVRKNGKRDKYYFSPSCGLKFNSRVEVSRYLDKAQNNQVSIARISKNVVVEKGIAEGLPQGWIKKTRVTTKGDTIRRDSYYIDPVSGYAFRSLKDVDRYLESGEIGRNAFKSKDKDISDMDLEDDTFFSAGEAKKPKLSVSRVTHHTVMGQNSNLDGIVNDQHIPKLECSGESMPLSQHISSQCVISTELTGSTPSQAECSDEKEVKVGLAESNLIPGCAGGVAPEKQLPEGALTEHETKKAQKHQRRPKRKAMINLLPLPCRGRYSYRRDAPEKQPSESAHTNHESMPLSEHISSQCVMDTVLTSSVLSQTECSDVKEVNVGLAESNLVPSCTGGVAPEKQFPERALTKHETEEAQKHQRRHKRKMMNLLPCPRRRGRYSRCGDAPEKQRSESAQTSHETRKAQKGRHKSMQKEILPRRASKRLAGIKLDPVPELITRRRLTVKHSGEGETITNEDKTPGSFPNAETKQFNALEGGSEIKCKFQSSKNTMEESSLSGQIKHSCGNLCNREKLPEKTVEEHTSEKNQECFSFLHLENQGTVKEQVDEKLDYTLNLPLRELLKDPCIAFAIQILTGVTFETSKNTQISSELNNSKYSETFSAAEGQNVGDWKQGINVSSPPKNLVTPEHAGHSEIDDKPNDNSGSSQLPLDISWMDPCIEFAVKTLTGNIPLEYNPNTETGLQQQLSSSNTQGHCEVALSNTGLGNLCQADYYCSQYLGTQKSVFKQQSFVEPVLPNARTAGARLLNVVKVEGMDARDKQ